MAARVLLVDDESELRMLWREVLEASGHEVVTAGSVAEVREAVGAGLRADVAIVDWTLPDGRGSDVREALRAGHVHCPVVFASGLGPLLPDGHGGVRVLTKPFRVKTLIEIIDEVVES